MATQGKVYLVGAGLGSVAYLTVRAQQLLVQAEVLVYDALVDRQLVELVPSTCLQLNVGKRGGQPSPRQEEINRLLVEQCQRGRQVVRLKSGDPFVFGRCTSEIQTLIDANCAFEVVPGISSALAGPLLSGIPLTDPVMSRCFAVMSAHDPDALNWTALASLETLVILMGGQQLEEIVYQLRRQGRSLSTPVAVIRWAGQEDQQIWVGTLGSIVTQTAHATLSPCVIVIGEVVGLRQYLAVDRGNGTRDDGVRMSDVIGAVHTPLAGKTILVTRSAGQSGQFSDRLQSLGATVIEMPALEIGPPSSWAELDGAIADLTSFDWLILTSTNGVDYFFERLTAAGKDARALAGVKIAVVGEKTATSLKQRGVMPDFIPPDFVADSMVANFPDLENLANCRILFPRVESGGREVLVAAFRERGATVIEVAAYQSRCPVAIATAALTAFQSGCIDIVTFASSKTVKHFCHLLAQANPNWQDWLRQVCVASIGPQTSETCRSLLGRVDVEAQEYTLEGLAQGLIAWATVLSPP